MNDSNTVIIGAMVAITISIQGTSLNLLKTRINRMTTVKGATLMAIREMEYKESSQNTA